MESLDKEEGEFSRVAELIESSYPELARNEILARHLRPDNVSQVLPEWVPDWVQALLLWLSPVVKVLADWLLILFNQLVERLPARWVQGFIESGISCASIIFNIAQVIIVWYHNLIQSPYMQPVLRILSPIMTESLAHPLRSVAFLASTWWIWHIFSSPLDDSRPSPPLVVQYSNT